MATWRLLREVRIRRIARRHELLVAEHEPQRPRPPDLYIRGPAGCRPPISPRSLKAIMTDKLTKKGR
jgi:hypothetical protein